MRGVEQESLEEGISKLSLTKVACLPPLSLAISPFVLPHMRCQAERRLRIAPSKFTPKRLSAVRVNEQRNNPSITEIKAGRLLTFLDLPGEVRNLIYLYALSANHNKSQSTLWLDRRGQTYSFGTSLLYLNRQVHAEASSIFYGANRFTIIRFSGVGVLLALLDKHMLAIALTCKAAFCTRMAMVICVQNSGDIGDGSWQLVIAARDIDILAMILFELQVEHDIIHTSLTVIILNNFGESDDEHSREVLKPMSMLRGFRKIKASKNLEEKSYKDLLGPTVNPLWVCDFMGFIDLLKRKGRAKSNEKNFSSAAFYFARACQIVRMGTALNPQFLQQPVNFKEIIANLAYLEAEALMKAKKYARAHQTTILILSYWKTSSAHGLSDSFKADVCHLRAELDELHGSLVKLKNALFWFQETLRLNPAHPTVKKAIKRLEKKIYFADTANW